MFKMMNGILDRFCAALGGFILAQFPQYIQQYMMRLSGHLEELKIHIRQMEQNSLLTGKSLEQYIQKFLNSQDPDFMHQGILIQKMVSRFNYFLIDLKSLKEASSITRPFVFLSHIKSDIAYETINSFQPGITFTMESLTYFLIGIVLGYLLYNGLTFGFKKIKQVSSF
jgi:hypothetical protein